MQNIYVTIDTETTIENTVYDFGCVVSNSKGEILHQMAVIVAESIDTELFYDVNSKIELWNKIGLKKRKDNYKLMLDNGSRMVASVNAINRWLDKVAMQYSSKQYNIYLTAYNLSFDIDKCNNTGIDLSMFNNRFCLWQASLGNICNTKAYKRFVLQYHAHNNVTDKRNQTIQTNAEIVSAYVTNSYITEPHTALEDILNHELPILNKVIKCRKWKDNILPYNWREWQLRDHYEVK